MSGSLLNDDKTQMLIPLIVHNLSRYNNSPYMCKEYFNLLLTQIPSATLREALKNSFSRLYTAIFAEKSMQNPAHTRMPERSQQENTEAQPADEPLHNYTTNTSQNQPLSGNSTIKNSDSEGIEDDIQQINKNAEENFVNNDEPDVTDEADEPEQLDGYRRVLNEAMSEKGYTQLLKQSGYNIERILSAYSRGKTSGMDAIKTLTQGLFPDGEEGEKASEQLMRELSGISTKLGLIDKLNEVLRSMPDIPLRERLYGVFVEVIDKMSVKNELPQHGVRPPVSSTLDSLTDFIQENINHPALKSLDSFNAANLLQSLLNAPGVFTPLAHYILPLDCNGTKAFGELWVDNDENNPNNTPGTQRNYHLFLTFDVESIGRFELDMYALGEEVNIALLYPPRFEKQIEPMKDRVNKIVRSCGYSTRAFETAPLKKPHNLVEIFPKITDKRTTLNTRV